MKKKIFITGGTGLLATNWALFNVNKDSIILGYNERKVILDNYYTYKVDFKDLDNTIKILNEIKPDIVINTIGLTNVDYCNKYPDISKLANEIIPSYIARACEMLSIPLVHLSTDHLFDGRKLLVNENEPICPLNEYGKSKGNAEHHIKKIYPKAIIIRTNFFGWGPSFRQSFSDFIITNLRNNKKINLFHDVYFTPILIINLIKNIYRLIEKNAFGVYNIVSDDRLSKYEFGIKLAKKFDLDTKLINLGSVINFNHLVLRPKDMSLSNKKFTKIIGKSIGSVDEQIDQLYCQEKTTEYLQIINL